MRYLLGLLLLSSGFWWFVSFTSCVVDLAIIGHIVGWKKIKYAKWLNSFLEKGWKKEFLSDCTTHPQVLYYLQIDILLFDYIIVTIMVWLSINEINILVLLIIDILLYSVILIKTIAIKYIGKQLYKAQS